MIAPFFELGDFGRQAALAAAVAIGIAFGWALERAGLGSAPKLAGQFYFADLTVFKVMFSAIVTAMLGVFWLSRIGVLDLARVYVPETYLLPQLAGGLLFGIGFVIAGLCPGTSCVAAATGRGDGLMVMLGMLAGVLGTGLIFGSISDFYNSTPRGAITLPQLLHVPYGVVVFAIVAMALIAFRLVRRLEPSPDATQNSDSASSARTPSSGFATFSPTKKPWGRRRSMIVSGMDLRVDRAPSPNAMGISDRASLAYPTPTSDRATSDNPTPTSAQVPSLNATQTHDRAPSPPRFSAGEKVPKADEGAFARSASEQGVPASSSSSAPPPSSGFATFSPRKKRGGRRRSIGEFGGNLRAQITSAALLLGALAAFAGSPYRAQHVTIDVQSLASAVAREEDHVTAIELAEWIRGRKAGLRVIDLRTQSEFETYHVPRAQRVALESIASTPFRTTGTIVLISGGGAHAAQAWVLLQALGYRQVYFLRGGLREWIGDVMNPTILATASPKAMAEFKRVGEISRYFGGVPRIVDKLEPRPADDGESGNRSSSTESDAAAIRRRGC